MQLEQQESFEIKGPQLEVFGEVETKLPAPAKKRPTALAVLVAAALVSVLGIGGAQLKGQWRETSEIYTNQIDEYGNGIQQDFSSQADAAASLIRIAGAVVGEQDADLQAAQTALENWNKAADRKNANEQYTLNRQLYTAIDTLYTAADDEADSKAKGQLTDLYDSFVSSQMILDRETAAYNQQVDAYLKLTRGFPGGVQAALWGVGDIPTFEP
ncbi:MAG: LemA family protein [Gemmiger sp.]|uniref:LemA family protein n=1 Tax=Gemmiger sp. TaxID=2049027 RepID=UPI002A90BB7D|nr:LemA family protein [Gemmiger sp.]MCI6383795.1 LemA family protein [Subdoligranulum variabile]MDY5203443.1 LemA family protein [Gemmiger sp.]